jgi:hypothetical protein
LTGFATQTIKQSHLALIVDQEAVLRLEVAVNDALFVKVAHGIGNAERDLIS